MKLFFGILAAIVFVALVSNWLDGVLRLNDGATIMYVGTPVLLLAAVYAAWRTYRRSHAGSKPKIDGLSNHTSSGPKGESGEIGAEVGSIDGGGD